MERKTKHFIEKNRRFIDNGRYSVEEYYQFAHLLRKELLSDVLEYESLVANMLIDNIGLFSIRPKDIEIFYNNTDEIIKEVVRRGGGHKLTSTDYYELNYKFSMEPGSLEIILHELKPDRIEDLYNQFNAPPRKDKHIKIEFHFEFMTMGSKIHVIQAIKEDIVKKALDEFLNGYEIYFIEPKEEIDALEDFLYPVLEFMRDIRNILAHRDIGLDFNDLFISAYNHNSHYIAEHKYKYEFMIKLFREQLLLIHTKTFYERIKDRVAHSMKIDNGIFNEVFSGSD